MSGRGNLLSSLPAPRQLVDHDNELELEYEKGEYPLVDESPVVAGETGTYHATKSSSVPPYGRRSGFIPRKQADFGNGGAYPEIHVAQYPLDMGRPGKGGAPGGGASRQEQTLALSLNAQGDVNYDAIVTQRGNSSKWIATGHKSLVPKLEKLNDSFERPAEEDEDEVARETALALAAKVSKKQAAVNPKNVPTVPGEAKYIKYTPAGVHSAANSRIIKMQDMPVDPLEPPKFPHIKVPRGSGSPPVPVMHSPPRKLSAQDHKDWKIPPCVSNWKNAKGYTIPLDKRLAADGRGLQEVQINDGFAKFSEALYIAENKARSAVETRAKMQRELLSREKERKEAELRDLAMQARMDRVQGTSAYIDRTEGTAVVPRRERDQRYTRGSPTYDSDKGSDDDWERGRASKEDREVSHPVGREEQRRRDEIREQRRKERERERRLEARNAHGYKRSKLTRDKDRDISEKIALGMAKVSGGEAMYDQRLFNQDSTVQAGMGAEDAYNLYDKPLFTDRSDVYRGKANNREGEEADIDTAKFKPSKGFTGADYSSKDGTGKGPVEFESDPQEADPFGLDAFLSDVRNK